MSIQPPPAPIRQFVQDYRRLRLAEGYASPDPTFARQLPFRDATGRNVAVWRLRALHYVVIRIGLACLPNVRRVLDVGAGNGWLARRLADRYQVTAIDVDVSNSGLGALDDDRVHRVLGDLESLPLRQGVFDVVIVAAALHYALDHSRALDEIARVLRPGGVVIVADSPVYRDADARQRAWERTFDYFATAGAAHMAARYRGLTRTELDGPGPFRFVTVSPGLNAYRALVVRLRGGEPGPRLPVLFGWKR